MSTLDKIKEPVAGHIQKYEEFLRESMGSDHFFVSTMLDYVFSTRGKGIRPLLAILSAALNNTDPQEELPARTMTAAMLLEMIHTATLVHDDVIDESGTRRGKPSVNALWKSRRAILIGDYILSRSYQIGMERGHYDVITYICGALSHLCEGELIQSDQSDRLEMTRDIYFEIISKKTAILLGTSSGSGALSVGASPEKISLMKQFGDNLGMAFQIRDDILDYTVTANTGKPACGDLKERKITLPLITVMENADDKKNNEIITLLSSVGERPENAETIRQWVVEQKGMEMAAAVMKSYVADAARLLDSYPSSRVKDSLLLLCSYVGDREF